ncbi:MULTISPECIES: helix-turn-helix domain-containing protein [unclassified Vibrio]|uniref:Helix-turn-helix domain-containing protein n=1 Tax=Vibrio sp. HB236076 TaxID=3232307 RepID=A0AB39HI34_9VIBR|nr:helix-turn-helix domain-containing protein [Vibrio sp. HB161653]MDP5254328.1 helix-turn-helix domain-containing protein [Vibrio sp. HB161653]
MSIPITQQVINISVGSMASKLLLIKLADQADSFGTSFPSHRFLSECCEASERTVRYQLKYLVEQGWITISNRHDARGRQRSNFYHLNLDKIRAAYQAFIDQQKSRRERYQSPKASTPSAKTAPPTKPINKSLDVEPNAHKETKSYPQANETQCVKTEHQGGKSCLQEVASAADHVGGKSCRHNLLEINKKTLSAIFATLPHHETSHRFDDLPFQSLREQVNLDDFEICRRVLKNKSQDHFVSRSLRSK